MMLQRALAAAYFVTAYFVGINLTRFQTIAVSSLYFIAASSATLSLVGGVQAWVAVKSSTPAVLDEVPIYNPVLWLTMMPIILVPGILVSLYFMWTVRHPKTE